MKKIFTVLLRAVLVLIVILVANACTEKTNDATAESESVVLRDAHGLAIDRTDTSKVYIATHSGLLLFQNDNKNLKRVSNDQDDYMGFTAHPTDAKIFYTSGHPSSGGNLGIQKSSDGGQTWTKLSDGIGGPVDFHAMTISNADPTTLYGFYQGQVQRSDDGGKSWIVASNNLSQPFALTTGSQSKDAVFAATSTGIFLSRDRGMTWEKTGFEDATTTLAINPIDDQNLLAYSVDQGFVNSGDGGATWERIGNYKGDVILQIAYDFKNPERIYAINQSLEIYKSLDGGKEWKKVRDGTEPVLYKSN